MEWLDLIGNAATGGLLGVFGSVIGGVTKYFQKKQEIEEAGRERSHELTLIEMEMKRGASETENELKIIEAGVAGNIREASYTLPVAVSGASVWVNNIRSLFRPFLTLALWGLLTGVVVMVLYGDRLSDLFVEGELSDLIKYVVQSIVFAASTATMWWFGDRALAPPGTKDR
jgi:hypothetical protein